VHGIG